MKEELTRALREVQLPFYEVNRNPRGIWGMNPREGFYIDVRVAGDKKAEAFRIFEGLNVNVNVIDRMPENRHLLLHINNPIARTKEKLLIGHDERHLFISGVTSNTKNLAEAFDKLKPPSVIEAIRKGKKVVRQGEWFFIPFDGEPTNIATNIGVVHKKRAIVNNNRRTFNPHIADEIMFLKPVTVEHPALLHYLRLNNCVAFVRGKVRHGQHSTVELVGWHKVYQNLEIPQQSVGYLD